MRNTSATAHLGPTRTVCLSAARTAQQHAGPRRTLRAAALPLFLALMAVLMIPQGPAHAHHAVGTASPAWVRCYTYSGTGSDGPVIWAHRHIRSAPGWERQWIAYQYFVSTYNPSTRQWSAWKADGPAQTTTATSQRDHISLSIFAPLNITQPGHHYVKTRYWWWDGSSWSQPKDYTTTSYTIATPTLAGELHRESNFCETSRGNFSVSMGPTVSTTFP
jgi:hypothetical protein